jgi:hypothetical protein
MEACEKASGVDNFWAAQVYLVALYANKEDT